GQAGGGFDRGALEILGAAPFREHAEPANPSSRSEIPSRPLEVLIARGLSFPAERGSSNPLSIARLVALTTRPRHHASRIGHDDGERASSRRHPRAGARA